MGTQRSSIPSRSGQDECEISHRNVSTDSGLELRSCSLKTPNLRCMRPLNSQRQQQLHATGCIHLVLLPGTELLWLLHQLHPPRTELDSPNSPIRFFPASALGVSTNSRAPPKFSKRMTEKVTASESSTANDSVYIACPRLLHQNSCCKSSMPRFRQTRV